VDSSALAAIARHSLGEGGLPLSTLSIIFDEPEFSEEYYSDLVAERINSDHQKIKITKQNFYDSFDEIFEAMDQPTIDGVNTFFIAKAAKQAGLKTVLSGLGSDEIFLGYPHFHRAELLRKIQQMPLKPVFQFFSSSVVKSLLGDRYSKLSYFLKDDALSFYLGIRGLFSPKETAKILDADLSEVNKFLNEVLITQLPNYPITQLPPVNLLSYLELKFYLQNQLLKDTDFMSMYHSVEVRVPFLDHPLVEYLSGLPPELKFNIRKSDLPNIDANLRRSDFLKLNKPLLVSAIADLLPQEILFRKKMGFTFPFEKWLRESLPITNYQLPITKSHWSRFWANIVLKNIFDLTYE
jgi:asparagine synthase (glutamine-hydrolysing)